MHYKPLKCTNRATAIQRSGPPVEMGGVQGDNRYPTRHLRGNSCFKQAAVGQEFQ